MAGPISGPGRDPLPDADRSPAVRRRLVEEIFDEILDREPVPPRQRDRDIPKRARADLPEMPRKCMTDRYATAADLGDDLRHLADCGASTQAASTPVPRRPRNDGKTRDSGRIAPVYADIVRTVLVRPKGLRAFDATIATSSWALARAVRPRRAARKPAVLEGPDRAREHEDPFSVGLLCGPSGSGKTSMIKAGALVPALRGVVTPVYVEASPGGTEARLGPLCAE